jgi:hypothetical protein
LRHLRTVSCAMTLLGAGCVAAALLIDLSPTVLLVGLMLIIAGAVKITMVALWHGVAGFGAAIAEGSRPESTSRTFFSHRKGRP